MKFAIIIPAHNEEDFLQECLTSFVKQTIKPTQLIVVNDSSTDSTEKIIDQFCAQYTFIQKVNTFSGASHMPGSKVINAFNEGLRTIIQNEFDYIGKFDADIILPNNYFEEVLRIFDANEKAGIVGGFAYEEDHNGVWKKNHPMHDDHVRGAFKLYSKSCFESIGFLKNSMGWDTVDELLARFHGFKIITEASLKVKHLRPTGANYNKKAKKLQGVAMYKMRYGFTLTTIASLKMALKSKKIKTFFHNLQGYFDAKKTKTPYLVTQEEGVFIRNYRYNGIIKKLF